MDLKQLPDPPYFMVSTDANYPVGAISTAESSAPGPEAEGPQAQETDQM